MKYIYAILVFAFFQQLKATELDQQKPYLANNDIDVISYDISGKIAQMPPQKIDLVATIELKTLVDSQTIDLHIESTVMTINSVVDEQNNLINFAIVNAGNSNKYGLSGDALRLMFSRIFPKDSTMKIKISYTIVKSDWSDDKGLYYKAEDIQKKELEVLTTRSWPYYARYWIPSNDAPHDLATIKLALAVPDGYKVAANGEIKSGDYDLGSGINSDGLRVFEWEQKNPTTTYNFVFSVGKFDIYKKDVCVDAAPAAPVCQESIPVVLYYNKNSPKAQSMIYNINRSSEALTFFTQFFGHYEYGKLGFVQIPSYPFSMESTGMIVLRGAGSAVHELVHQWWGNNVHIKHWGDFWISEGFTSYLTGLYDEFTLGTNTAVIETPQAALNNPAETDPNDIFDNTPYRKGAGALASLRSVYVWIAQYQMLPPPTQGAYAKAYFRLIKKLYQNYKFNELSTEEFINFTKLNTRDCFLEENMTIDQAKIDYYLDWWVKQWFIIPSITTVNFKKAY